MLIERKKQEQLIPIAIYRLQLQKKLRHPPFSCKCVWPRNRKTEAADQSSEEL